MKITEHIAKSKGKTLFSFEIVPPMKGQNIQKLYDNIAPLMAFNPPFIDVTTSREEYVYLKKEGGLLERKKTRLRPGTLGICACLKHKYNIDPVPHILCGGFSKEETEYMLVDCHYLGIENVMALRGDSRKDEAHFTPEKEGNHYALDLVAQIENLNKGIFLHQTADVSDSHDFCVGIAGYPEKHMEAPSLQADIERLKEKVAAGADYVVTQMFFDNQKYFHFVKKAREIGITVPIIPGIKPIAIQKHLQILPKVFSLDLPQELVSEIQKCKNNQQVREVGIQWAIAQSKELIKAGVPVVHYYSMGKSDNIMKIAKNVF